MVSVKLQTAFFCLLGLVVGAAVVGVCSFVFLNYILSEPKIATPVEAIYPEDVETDRTESQSVTTSHKSTDILEFDLQRLLSKSQFERSKALHDLLRHTDIDSVLKFLEQNKTTAPSDLRHEVQEVAIRRLVQLDPIAALHQVNDTSRHTRNSLMIAVFDEWSGENLEEALAHAASFDEEDKRYALEGILISRLDLSDGLRLDLIRKLGHEQVFLDSQALVMAGAPVEDPASAWIEFLDQQGGDVASLSDAQLVLLKHIVDSWIDLGIAKDVASSVGSALQNSGKESAVQLVLETLARHDPTVAFRATSSIEDSEQRTQMQQAIVAEWLKADPLAVLEAVELIPIDLQDWSKQEALVALSVTSPSEAVNRLGVISTSEARDEVALSIAGNWAKLDPEAAREWAVSDPEVQHLRWDLMSELVSEVSLVDPNKALKWALMEPVKRQRFGGGGLEETVIRSLALQGKYEAAISMVELARDIENQQWSYIQIGNVMAERGKSGESWDLYEKIPERFHGLYREHVSTNWVWNEPDIALENLKDLPSQEQRIIVAIKLVTHNQIYHTFSIEQMRELKKFLPERYQQMID